MGAHLRILCKGEWNLNIKLFFSSLFRFDLDAYRCAQIFT